MVQARGALLYGRLGSLADGSHSLSKHIIGGFTPIIPHDVAFFWQNMTLYLLWSWGTPIWRVPSLSWGVAPCIIQSWMTVIYDGNPGNPWVSWWPPMTSETFRVDLEATTKAKRWTPKTIYSIIRRFIPHKRWTGNSSLFTVLYTYI